MKIKTLSFFLSFLIIGTVYASETTGNISTGGSNAVGNLNTGGSQSTTTTTVSGTVIVTPTSNVLNGVYVHPINVILSALNSDSIHYTLDSSIPTCSSGNTFGSSISLNSTTTLKALSCYGIKSSSVVTWQYNFKALRTNQDAPTNGSLTLQSSSTQAVLTNQDTIVNLTVPTGIATPTIDVSTFIQNGSGTLPEINITSNNANNSVIKIPSGSVVSSASSTWDGVISAPVVKTLTLPNPSGFTRSFSKGIELGLSGTKLSFTKGVRILVGGQAGKKVGWTRDDTNYTEITSTCSADNQTVGDALATDGDCKIDVNSDVVIWTKHFTTFVTYTETAVSSGGGGGGGGGGGYVSVPTTTSTTSTTTVITTSTAQPITVPILVNKFIFTKNLALGSTGSEVLELQKLLVSLGFLKATPNGNYGPATKQAVISFQIANKISPVGTVGPQTRITLNSQTQTTTTITPQTASTSQISTIKARFISNLQLGSKGDEVLSLQRVLYDLGLLKATPNSNFGPQTRLAVMLYQKQNNISQTGTIGPLTRSTLNK